MLQMAMATNDRIESHYNSDYNLLKNAMKIAMSDMLDIIARLK